MKFAVIYLIVILFAKQVLPQNKVEDIIHRCKLKIKSTIESSFIVRTYDSHANEKIDTLNARVSFDANKVLLYAERLFEDPKQFSYYYFENNKLTLCIFTMWNGDIMELLIDDEIKLKFLPPTDKALVKEIIEKAPNL